MPTIATLTGSYRSMKVYIPKHQSMQLKNVTQVAKKIHLDECYTVNKTISTECYNPFCIM